MQLYWSVLFHSVINKYFHLVSKIQLRFILEIFTAVRFFFFNACDDDEAND